MRGSSSLASRLILAAWLGAAVAACAAGPAGTASFRDGYRDGCDSGYSDARRVGYQLAYVKDEGRFATDADYQSGWKAGYRACFDEEWRTPYLAPAI